MSNFKNEVLTILNENSNKKVSSIIELIEELEFEQQKSQRQKTYLMDDNNQPFAIFCYYHKQWELVAETEYGVKASTKTGLNTMCKLGTNMWTKQQKVAKQEQADLLERLIEGDITTDEANDLKNEIESNRTAIDLEGSKGYEFDEVVELLKQHNNEL